MEKRDLFLMFLNSTDSNFQFTIEVSGNELCFLDLKLTLKDNKIQTTVYSKPTDSHLHLQVDSCHHLRSILGIQKGVALRLRRICSTDQEYNNNSKEYKAYLIGRGHKLFCARNDVINVRTLWSQKVVSNVSLQKEFTKLDGLPHVFPKM